MTEAAEVATLTEGRVAAGDCRPELRRHVLKQVDGFLTGIL
jgi:hypothetical protein